MTFLGMPARAPRGVGHLRGDESFPAAARKSLTDTQLRGNLGHHLIERPAHISHRWRAPFKFLWQLEQRCCKVAGIIRSIIAEALVARDPAETVDHALALGDVLIPLAA